MGYLIASDFNRLIQDVNLQQIISGNSALQAQAELAAIEEMSSYLRAKYDVAAEFTDTTIYSNSALYKAGNRVYLDANAYSTTATYIVGQLVRQTSNIYRCTTNVSIPESFNIAKWELLGAQYDIFYAIHPQPVFNINSVYKKDDEVYWKDKTYTCIIPTSVIDQESLIQYNNTDDLPYSNVLPDDANYGVKYWGAGVAYSVPSGSVLDTDYFKKGDNRNQQLILYVLDVLIYHLYRRIPPAVVPELRVQAYYAVIEWLKKVSGGNDVVADITKIQPAQGGRISYGSRPKQQNYY